MNKKSKNFSLLPIILLFFILILNKISINTSCIPILFISCIFLFVSFLEKECRKYSITIKTPILEFLWKLSLLFFLFFSFYNYFIFKNSLHIENILLLFLALLPILLKPILTLSFLIKYFFLRKKYSIKKKECIDKILNLKRLVITSKERKQDKIKIKYLFSNNKKIKKIDPILKKAISLFHYTKEEKLLLKSLKIKESKCINKKISCNKIICDNKIYKKGNVLTLLKQATHTIKNNKKVKLNQSSRNYILSLYRSCLMNTDKMIAYIYEDEKEKKTVFLGFVGIKNIKKQGYDQLQEIVEITSTKEKSTDVKLKELEIEDFHQLYSLIKEVQVYKKNQKKAIAFYLLHKIIFTICILFSFSININFLTINSLLFLEFIFLSILFLEITFFSKYKKINIKTYILDICIKSIFQLFLIICLFPYFNIHSMRYILFFSLLVGAIFSVYSYVLDTYESFFKEKYLNIYLLFIVILLLLIYKTNLLCLSFLILLFILCIQISLYLFLEIFHKMFTKKE